MTKDKIKYFFNDNLKIVCIKKNLTIAVAMVDRKILLFAIYIYICTIYTQSFSKSN